MHRRHPNTNSKLHLLQDAAGSVVQIRCIDALLERSDLADLESRIIGSEQLVSLVLWNNQLNTYSAYKIARAIEDNHSVTMISIGKNNIGPGGALAFSEILGKHRATNILALNATQIGSRGACTLAKTLQSSGTLEHLSLIANNITDVGIRILAESLIDNKTLRSLCLSGNELGSAAKTALSRLQHSCPELTIEFPNIDSRGYQLILNKTIYADREHCTRLLGQRLESDQIELW